MTEQTSDPKRVLVTGSTGAIGQPVCAHLQARGHYVRGFARRPTPGVEDYVEGDLNDRDAVYRAVEGVDTIVHLGAYPNPADFIDVLLQPNVVGQYYVCEAAKDLDIERLILSSTIQTVSGHSFKDRPISVADGPKPTNHYALTKVWAEVMGDMYARVHNLSVLSVRICWLPRNPTEALRLMENERGPDVYFSHADAQRFYERAVESPNPARGESAIVFAASRPKYSPRLDLAAPQQLIGYVPEDTWPEGLPYELTFEVTR